MSRPILVVDDDPTILATVSETLDLEGYPVVTATNGAEALEQLELQRPSLVLLDMRMPVLDGWGFIRAVRERGLSPVVVVMTAAADARRWASEIGAQGVLAKPFDLDELIAAVQRLGPKRRGAPPE
ncbi:MAG TPA: response regulator [Chloroflexota bacterium]|jgi:CheY-like chemotaxis protein